MNIGVGGSGYRKDIQVLRGVAVLLVVLFHLDVVGFRSGFLGVDVFFVISGYLMAVMYDPRKKGDFFLKRAKRLLPAYFTTVVLTLVAGVFIVAPNDFGQLATQSVFSLFFSSNIGFWVENSYFDKASFKPLLHLWSLGVEIQFYLLVPFLFWLFCRSRVIMPAVIVISALMCFLLVGVSPKTPFFLLPFRIWEFLIGFGVARYLNGSPRKENAALGWVGFFSLMVIIGIPFIEVNGASLGFVHGHPGLAALCICLATAAVLVFGLPRKIEATSVAALLERVGGYSYSIYLAHFPVIVLFLYQPFGGTITKSNGWAETAMLAALIAGLSAALYALVERPFRHTPLTRGMLITTAVSIVVISQVGIFAKSLLLPANEMRIYGAWLDRDEYRCGKLIRILHPGSISCELTGGLGNPARRVLLVGNSHADSIKSVFVSEAKAKNVAVHFMVENDPLIKAGTKTQGVMREAADLGVDSIVLHYSPLSITDVTIRELVDLSEQKGIGVSLVLPVPVWRDHIPVALLNNLKRGDALPSQSISDYEELNKQLIDGVSDINYSRFKVYPTASVFCDSKCRFLSGDGHPLYFDRGHLTLTGAEELRDVFRGVVDDIALAGG